MHVRVLEHRGRPTVHQGRKGSGGVDGGPLPHRLVGTSRKGEEQSVLKGDNSRRGGDE